MESKTVAGRNPVVRELVAALLDRAGSPLQAKDAILALAGANTLACTGSPAEQAAGVADLLELVDEIAAEKGGQP